MKNQNRILGNERGIAFVVEIVIGAVVLGVIGLAAMQYMKMKDSGTSSSLIPAKVTLNGNCELKDTDLCKFTNNWKGMDNFSVKILSTDKAGKKSDTLYEISGSDKYHLTSGTNGKEEYSLISIGSIQYTKDYTDGKWWEYGTEKSTTSTTATTDKSPKSDFDFNSDPSKGKTQYKALGKEACDKLKCFKYEVIDPGTTDKEYIWFDDRDYLLRRMQTAGAESGTSDMTFTYTKPNISAPTPTKKMTADTMPTLPPGTFDPAPDSGSDSGTSE